MKARSTEEMGESLSPGMAALRAENKELHTRLNVAKREAGETQEIVSAIVAAVKQAKPVAVKNVKAGTKVTSPVSLVVQLTDLHVGLRTRADSVEGFGEYNYALAQSRLRDFAARLANWVELQRSSYTVNECVILGTSDWISGDIHEGLIRTNEFPAPVQAVKAGMLISEFVLSLASQFEKLRVEFITMGNHDRLTRKPQAQDGGYNSWGFVVGHMAAEVMRRQPNLQFNIYPHAQDIVEVQGTRYLIGHGAGIIGTWGIPYYGIDRRKQREAMARMNMPEHKHFHKIVLGHFHQALNHEHWLVGGSLSGTDENDHAQGRHSPPHQTAWFVHPKHGEFSWTRWAL